MMPDSFFPPKEENGKDPDLGSISVHMTWIGACQPSSMNARAGPKFDFDQLRFKRRLVFPHRVETRDSLDVSHDETETSEMRFRLCLLTCFHRAKPTVPGTL